MWAPQLSFFPNVSFPISDRHCFLRPVENGQNCFSIWTEPNKLFTVKIFLDVLMKKFTLPVTCFTWEVNSMISVLFLVVIITKLYLEQFVFFCVWCNQTKWGKCTLNKSPCSVANIHLWIFSLPRETLVIKVFQSSLSPHLVLYPWCTEFLCENNHDLYSF